jgi:hypothetical protein
MLIEKLTEALDEILEQTLEEDVEFLESEAEEMGFTYDLDETIDPITKKIRIAKNAVARKCSKGEGVKVKPSLKTKFSKMLKTAKDSKEKAKIRAQYKKALTSTSAYICKKIDKTKSKIAKKAHSLHKTSFAKAAKKALKTKKQLGEL